MQKNQVSLARPLVFSAIALALGMILLHTSGAVSQPTLHGVLSIVSSCLLSLGSVGMILTCFRLTASMSVSQSEESILAPMPAMQEMEAIREAA